MSRKKLRSPQEKKALSYANDRRNTYGENDKASRKLIPLRKAAENRKDRRKVAQEVTFLGKLDEGAADVLESSVRHDVHRVGGWRKAADDPLGKIVGWAKEAREASIGRKARSSCRQATAEAEDADSLRRQAASYRRTARRYMRLAKSGKSPELAKEIEQSFLRKADEFEERAAALSPELKGH